MVIIFAVIAPKPHVGTHQSYKTMRKNLLIISAILLAAFAAMIVSSCNNAIQQKRMITVSILPQKFMLEKIVGDKFVISCMLNEGNNPEAYEPSMTHLMNIEHSVAYFCIGYIGFEYAIIDKAHANNPDLKIYNNSDGIETIQGTHFSPEGKHDEADPHLWTSVRNAMTISKNMLDAVIELDPDNAKTYTANFNNFKAELETLDAEIKAKLAAKQGSAFLVWHPSLSYFAQDYGLKQVSLEYEGKEIPIDKLKQNIDAARESKATVLFVQQEFDSRQAETIGNELGVKMIKINPMGYEWESELTKIADAIANN